MLCRERNASTPSPYSLAQISRLSSWPHRVYRSTAKGKVQAIDGADVPEVNHRKSQLQTLLL